MGRSWPAATLGTSGVAKKKNARTNRKFLDIGTPPEMLQSSNRRLNDYGSTWVYREIATHARVAREGSDQGRNAKQRDAYQNRCSLARGSDDDVTKHHAAFFSALEVDGAWQFFVAIEGTA